MIARALALLVLLSTSCHNGTASEPTTPGDPAITPLPSPPTEGASVSLDQVLRDRRSVRDFADRPLETSQTSSLLWAAQGITGSAEHYRTVPSAGALHPLELYLVAGMVEGLDPGVYHYRIADGALDLIVAGDKRADLCQAALRQDSICSAPASVVIAADYQRTTRKYRQRGQRYVHIEVGHVAQNIYLQATALGLGTVSIGAFDDDAVQGILGIRWEPLLIMPVGWPDQG